MASDDLKRHPPTERRLEQLRRAGDVPHSPALTWAVAVAAGSLAAVTLGPTLVGWLGTVMAQDLQQAAAGEATGGHLAGLLTAHLATALVVTVSGVGVVAGGAVVGHLLQTGLRASSTTRGHGPLLPGATVAHGPAKPAKRPWLSLELLVGLAGLGLLVAQMGQRLLEAEVWDEALPAREAGVLWWRWLAVLGALGLLQLARARASYWRRVAMSDRELQEEARETAGPPLTRQRRLSLRGRAQHEA